MTIAAQLLPEFDNEMATTRRLLAVLPESGWDWRPHPKSTPLGELANHLCNLAAWLPGIMATTDFDLATAERPGPSGSKAELLDRWDTAVTESRAAIAESDDAAMLVEWTFRNGDQNGGQAVFTLPRVASIRTLIFNHSIHHRGQLSVYLRLRDIPLPSIYGPSADTPMPGTG